MTIAYFCVKSVKLKCIVVTKYVKLNHVFCENYVLVEIFSRAIFVSALISELDGEVCNHEYFLRCCHIVLNFNKIFCKNFALVRILSKNVFVSMFIKELHDGVCGRTYTYHVITSHSTLIMFPFLAASQRNFKLGFQCICLHLFKQVMVRLVHNLYFNANI